MKRKLLPGLLAAMMLSSVGCAVLRVEADTSKPVLLNNPQRLPVKKHFEVSGSQFYFFWGLVGNGNRAVNDTILRELGRNEGIVNLKVKTEFSFVDQLVSAVTLGIIGPRSYTVSGDIVD